MEPVTNESIKYRFIYNPYLLHLFYVKLRYLFNLLNRLYRQRIELEGEKAFNALLEYCTLDGHYAECLVEELALFLERMTTQSFPIELTQCHFEVQLFRVSQIFRCLGESVDPLFDVRYYRCETKLLEIFTRDLHRGLIGKLTRDYIERYYIHYTKENSVTRVTLFFNLKQLLEKAIDNDRLDKAENAQYFIRYDQELSSCLFYLYFFSELYCINELNMTRIDVSECIELQANLFLNTREKRQHELKKSTSNAPILRPEVTELSNAILLQKAFYTVHEVYHELVIQRISFYTKDTATTTTTTTSLFSSFFSASTETKQYNNARETSHELALQVINREYSLSKPLTEVVSPMLTNVNGTVLKKIGRADLYASQQAQITSVPLTYLPLKENLRLYTLCLYRLAFEIKLAEAHTSHCKGQCYLCGYYQRSYEIFNLKSFFDACHAYDLDYSYGLEANKYQHLCEVLDRIHIDLFATLTLRHYRTIVNVFWLFEHVPLKVKDSLRCYNLFHMIDPLALVQSLSRTVNLSKLDQAMWHLLCESYKKLRLEPEMKLIENEQALAMECEIVRLFSEQINMQCNEIQRYERSLSTEVTLDATQLCREVAAALKNIYLAYLNALLKIIWERAEQVNFDI